MRDTLRCRRCAKLSSYPICLTLLVRSPTTCRPRRLSTNTSSFSLRLWPTSTTAQPSQPRNKNDLADDRSSYGLQLTQRPPACPMQATWNTDARVSTTNRRTELPEKPCFSPRTNPSHDIDATRSLPAQRVSRHPTGRPDCAAACSRRSLCMAVQQVAFSRIITAILASTSVLCCTGDCTNQLVFAASPWRQ